MTKFYYYKMKVDNGGAPCTHHNLLSLAICKPSIRSTASEGNILLGFAGNDIDPENGLIYAAKVSAVLRHGEYYKNPRFADRPDCIYEWKEPRYDVRAGAQFHGGPDDLTHDLGKAPHYARANVLLSEEFRYFGSSRFSVAQRDYPTLRERLRNLKQGHRVNHIPALLVELQDLCSAVFAIPPSIGRGKSTHTDARRCVRDDDSEECSANS